VAAAVRAIRRKPQLSGGSLTFTLLGWGPPGGEGNIGMGQRGVAAVIDRPSLKSGRVSTRYTRASAAGFVTARQRRTGLLHRPAARR
jgi:hypothetical protein